MPKLDLDEVIRCLCEIAKILKHQPEKALKELREISSLIDEQVPFRDGHTKRVNEYSLMIGKALRFTDQQMVLLEAAALLHDFGKIGIDEDILMKPSSLTKAERMEVEMHVLRGYYILQGFSELSEVIKGVKSHHEFYDGSGYPNGLAKQNIPLMGRIIAVADAYDAMTSERPYRRAKSKQDAIEELKKHSGTQFDPEIVKLFIKIINSKK